METTEITDNHETNTPVDRSQLDEGTGITLKTETPHQSIKNINEPDQSNKGSDADIENRILHRKHLSKPIFEITQEPNNRGTGPRGPDDRFTKSPQTFTMQDSDCESENTEEPESPRRRAVHWEEVAQN